MCAFSVWKGEGGRVGVKGQGSVIEFISKQTNELRAAAAEAVKETQRRQRFQASDKRSSVQ